MLQQLSLNKPSKARDTDRRLLVLHCLEAIDRLDIRIAHLGVAQWLHIHGLYETSARDVGDRDTDDFVIVTVWIGTRP
jgi:hypothetical protein